MNYTVIAVSGLIFAGAALAEDTTPKGNTGLPNGEFLTTGWHDYGSCNGDDTWHCSGATGMGCQRPSEQCKSQFASVVAVEPGDRKCVINWFRWECRDKGVAYSTSPEDTPAVSKWRNEMRMRNEAVLSEHALREGWVKARRLRLRKTNPCVLSNEHFSDEATIVIVGAHTGSGSTRHKPWSDGRVHSSIKVDTDPLILRGRPAITLLLSNAEPVEWKLSSRLARYVESIVVSGDHDSLVTGVPHGAPIAFSNKQNRLKRDGNLSVDGEGCTAMPNISAYRGNNYIGIEDQLKRFGGGEIDFIAVDNKSPAEIVVTTSNKIQPNTLKPLSYRKAAAKMPKKIASGHEGVTELLKLGLIRQATLDDISIVEQNATARIRALEKTTTASSNITFSAGKTYILNGAITMPANLKGFTFFLPAGVPYPILSGGQIQLYTENNNTMSSINVHTRRY